MLSYANLEPFCLNGCEIAPRCPKCGQVEVLAPGIDYYCPDCKVDLKELMSEYHPVRPMAYPGVAVSVIIFDKEERVLLGKRKGPLGTGQYSLPGGKVDFGEAPLIAAMREVAEETFLQLRDVWFTGKVSNDWFPEQGKHFINLFYVGTAVNPEDLHVPESEKEKFDEWLWFSQSELPEGVWMHTAEVIKAVFKPGSNAQSKMPGIDI